MKRIVRRAVAVPITLVLAVPAGAAALVLEAGPSTATGATATASWFHDPISKAGRGKEIAVPKHPTKYAGSLRHTKADYRTRSGAIAVPIAWAHGHALADGQAVVLNKSGLFRFDSATPDASAKHQVKSLNSSLANATRVTCEGYTDYGGDRAHEKSLSKKRAAAVCTLIHHRRPAVKTSAVGYDSARPVIVGGAASKRAENRRVVMVVTKTKAKATVTRKVPTAPTLTSATAGNASASIAFTRPTSAGTSPITDYQVSTGGTWRALTTAGTAHLTAHLTGLTNDTTYSVRVRAINAVGNGPASNSRDVTPSDGTPGPPNLLSLTPDYVTTGPSSALLNFTFTNAAPNGSPVTGYQFSQDGEHWYNLTWTAGTPNTSAINVSWNCVPDVDSVTIRGVNAVGSGAPSNTRTLTLDAC